MGRIVLGVIGGFVAWVMLWLGSEWILSALLHEFYGVHQAAFQAAIEDGGPFTADSTLLLIHIIIGSLVSVVAGFVAALISGENQRAPLALGILLLAFGLLKAVMSWPYAPIWYHIIFTVMLVPMTLMGGKLRKTRGAAGA